MVVTWRFSVIKCLELFFYKGNQTFVSVPSVAVIVAPKEGNRSDFWVISPPTTTDLFKVLLGSTINLYQSLCSWSPNRWNVEMVKNLLKCFYRLNCGNNVVYAFGQSGTETNIWKQLAFIKFKLSKKSYFTSKPNVVRRHATPRWEFGISSEMTLLFTQAATVSVCYALTYYLRHL